MISLPIPAAAVEELEVELGLYNRFVLQRAAVERLLRFDDSASAFDVGAYLNPARNSTDYAGYTSAGIYYAPTKWIGFGFSVDSGEIRPRGRIPAATEVPVQTVLLRQLLGASSLPALSSRDRFQVTANGQPIGDEARDTFFIRQAFVRLAAPATEWLTLTAGRKSADVGDGLIYNDYGLGTRLTADLERLRNWPIRVSAQLVLPTRRWDKGLSSPLVEARSSYIISMMEEVGLLFSFFHDGDNAFEQLLSPIVAEIGVWAEDRLSQQIHNEVFALATQTAIRSEADLFWVGLSGNKLLGDFNLSLTTLVQFGELRLENPFSLIANVAQRVGFALPTGNVIRRDTLGVAVDASVTYPITSSLNVGAWFLFLTGDDNPLLQVDGSGDEITNSFFSVVPYLTHTNIFFSGGMNETFSGRRGATAGLNGRGVIAPGLQAEWEINDNIKVGLTSAALLSHAPSLTGGRFYGAEVDVEGRWEILDWMAVSLEYDFLVPGDFFTRDTAIQKFLVGFDLSYAYEY